MLISSGTCQLGTNRTGCPGGRRAVRAHGAGLWRDVPASSRLPDKGSAMQSRALAGLANHPDLLPARLLAPAVWAEQRIRISSMPRTRPCNFVALIGK